MRDAASRKWNGIIIIFLCSSAHDGWVCFQGDRREPKYHFQLDTHSSAIWHKQRQRAVEWKPFIRGGAKIHLSFEQCKRIFKSTAWVRTQSLLKFLSSREVKIPKLKNHFEVSVFQFHSTHQELKQTLVKAHNDFLLGPVEPTKREANNNVL